METQVFRGEFVIEGLNKAQIDKLTEWLEQVVSDAHGTIAGGFVDITDEEEAEDGQQ